jgi:twitching motility protein PilT
VNVGAVPRLIALPQTFGEILPASGNSATGASRTVAQPRNSLETMLHAMLQAAPNVSDLIFSPGKPPQVEVRGQLLPFERQGILSADETRRIASELLGSNQNAVAALREHGSCDTSYGLTGIARFRVNVFIQRGSCAVVMRVIPTTIPDFAALHLPAHLAEIAGLRDGIVLVAGPAGSGKSSTLAAMLDRINATQSYHVVTVEDPIEFLHNHKRCTIHQRELHSDTPSFALALKAALRQSPKVILVGDIRDRETVETVLEAAETGHLVLSSLHANSAAETFERLVASFSPGEQVAVRSRLARLFRYVVCQKLLPRRNGEDRALAVEIVKSTPLTREYVELGAHAGRTLAEAMRADMDKEMRFLDHEIANLVRAGEVDLETALLHAANPAQLREELSLSKEATAGSI